MKSFQALRRPAPNHRHRVHYWWRLSLTLPVSTDSRFLKNEFLYSLGYFNLDYQCTNQRKYSLHNRLILGCHLHRQLQLRDTLLAATSGSQITNMSQDIWLTMKLKTGRGHSINIAVLWTGKPNQQTLFLDNHLERSATHKTAPPFLFTAVFL